MRAIRELPLAASLLLAGVALFFGQGPGAGSLAWLGGAALAAIVALVALRGLPAGWKALAPFAGLAAWLWISVSWSVLPDRSWDYANRTAVYFLFALLGLWVAARTRELALGLMGLFGAVLVWSLLGKVLPVVYDYGSLEVGRLRGPVGLWNQLALVAAFALPLALWRRRLEGALLVFVATAALLLTYSRGGLVTAVLAVAAWLALDDERVESARTLLAGAVPGAAAAGIAFALPGVTGDAQSSHARWRDGLIFGVLLVLGAIGAALLRRVALPNLPRRVLLGLGAVVIAALVVVVVRGGGSGAVGNSSGRLTNTSSNFRFTWWGQAVHGWEHHELLGTGAGTFHVTNLLYRHSFVDYTTEPHNVPLQFLTEAGVVGLVLFLLAAAALLRGTHRRQKHELALALLLPAYLVHSLVDIDWDFVAVSAPAFLAAGALVGRVELLRRVSAFGAALAAGAALLLFGVLLLPWLGQRWSNEALDATRPATKISLAKKARSVDPLLVEPYWWQADAQTDAAKAAALYQAAVDRQPKNAQTWLNAGLYGVSIGCPRLAYYYLERFTELDPKARPSEGADAYREALRQVNTGIPKC